MSAKIVIEIIDTTPGKLMLHTYIQENTGLHAGLGLGLSAFAQNAIGDLLISLLSGRISCADTWETKTLKELDGLQTASGNIPRTTSSAW
jgi:hypothetical protein